MAPMVMASAAATAHAIHLVAPTGSAILTVSVCVLVLIALPFLRYLLRARRLRAIIGYACRRNHVTDVTLITMGERELVNGCHGANRLAARCCMGWEST
jgi:hypothetical protein